MRPSIGAIVAVATEYIPNVRSTSLHLLINIHPNADAFAVVPTEKGMAGTFAMTTTQPSMTAISSSSSITEQINIQVIQLTTTT